MTVVTKLDNPYWEIVQTFPQDRFGFSRRAGVFSPDSYPFVSKRVGSDKPLDILKDALTMLEDITKQASEKWEPSEAEMKLTRSYLVTQYAWAIPSDAAIHWLVDQLKSREVIELGAGNGYWAFLLEQMGISVTCYDRALPWMGDENHWFKEDTKVWHPVRRGTQAMIKNHQDKVLFLCWPPYGSDFAEKAVRRYQGNTLVFCGENEGGCCADDGFFNLLGEQWEETACYDDHIQWSGIHDYIWVYQRKQHLIREEP